MGTAATVQGHQHGQGGAKSRVHAALEAVHTCEITNAHLTISIRQHLCYPNYKKSYWEMRKQKEP